MKREGVMSWLVISKRRYLAKKMKWQWLVTSGGNLWRKSISAA